MPDSDIFVAKESFFAAELNTMVKKGERVRRGHELLNGREDLFDPVDISVTYDIETATASPGEKRGASQPSIQPPAPTAPPSTSGTSPATADLEALSRQDLMKRAVDAGVPAKGSSADLIEAIRAAEQTS